MTSPENDRAVDRASKKVAYRDLLTLLHRLEEARIAFTLHQSRDDALMIKVTVPGERWEIEFVDYGDECHVEVERFVSNGHIGDESALADLFARFSDKEEQTVTHDQSARS